MRKLPFGPHSSERSAIQPGRYASRISDVPSDDPRHLTAAPQLIHSLLDGALEREIALPQAERDGVARQVRVGPGDAPAFVSGERSGEQPFGDAGIEAAVA